MKALLKTCAASALGLVLTILLPFAGARAQSEVLQSTVPELAVGSKLSEKQTIKLPEGALVRVLITSTGTTKTLKGPYNGTVEAYEEKRSWWDRLTGHGAREDPPIGATRGLRAPQ